MTTFLLKIKALFRLFGIDISFVKKQNDIVPLNQNTEKNQDKFWANPKNEKIWKNPELMKFYKQLVNIVKSKGFDLNKKEILDAGCGAGSLLIFINEEFEPSINCGYEFSNKAIEIAKRRFPSANYYYKNLIEQQERQFDFIFCTEVLEHILKPQVVFQNLLAMMKNEAGLIITVPDGRKDTYDGHINFWSPESWKVFIETYASDKKFETGIIQGYGIYALIWAE